MTQRILVIDDTQDILDFLRTILEKQGYEVYVSKIVFADLHEVEHLHPDLIILDFMMGKQKEGWHMLQRLKAYPPTASLPVIVSSIAMTIPREQIHYFQRQGIPSLGKPFEIEHLLETVARMLQPPPS
jgi:DNA-binding response OmpR family regulator